MAKRIITVLLALLGALLAVALVYVAYVMVTYERLPDNLALTVDAPLAADEAAPVVSADEEFTVVTANLGFGAYNRDFDFFMDGGTGSVAESPEVVREDILGSAEAIRALSPDFVLFQEVDTDGTRSHHIDEYELLRTQFPSDWSVFCQNYDSAFLAWPLYAPHGANRAGLATFSRLPVGDPVRKSLPISESFSKFLDLDRCYSIVRVPAGDAELVLFNVHLSAYGADACQDLVLIPFKTNLEDSDLTTEEYNLTGLLDYPILANAGCFALQDTGDAAALKSAESAVLWLYSSGDGEKALTNTLGVITPWNTASDTTTLGAMQVEQVNTAILPGIDLPTAAAAQALTANEEALQGGTRGKAERTAFTQAALAALGAE